MNQYTQPGNLEKQYKNGLFSKKKGMGLLAADSMILEYGYVSASLSTSRLVVLQNYTQLLKSVAGNKIGDMQPVNPYKGIRYFELSGGNE